MAEESPVSAYVQEVQDDGSCLTQVIEKQRMIRIAQRPGEGISIIVVDTVRDSDKVYRYSAKNESLLKTKHPKGYALYERYVKNRVEMPDMDARDLADTAETSRQEQFFRQWQQMQQQMQRQLGGQSPGGTFSQQSSQQGSARGAFSRSSARASASGSASSSSSSSSSSSGSSSGSSRRDQM
jgi:hypothetical protein